MAETSPVRRPLPEDEMFLCPVRKMELRKGFCISCSVTQCPNRIRLNNAEFEEWYNAP